MLFVACLGVLSCPAAAQILSIHVTDSHDPVMAFTPYTYTIDYSFNTLSGESATIIDQLPLWAQFDSATGGGIYDPSTHSVQWEVQQTSGSSVSVTVFPHPPIPLCGEGTYSYEFQNTATISYLTNSETYTEPTTINVLLTVGSTCVPEFPSVAVPVITGITFFVVACMIRRYHR
jgi:hypothetical protein